MMDKKIKEDIYIDVHKWPKVKNATVEDIILENNIQSHRTHLD